ncbi:MAG TPA: PsiF family protein [Gallionella sp.]|nr:PsiF family protein [Gallionella sp.]
MNRMIALACLGFAFAVSAPAFAGSQQDKMRGCNAEARSDNLKGAERKAFMKKCLKKDYVLKTSAVKSEAKATAKAAAPSAKVKQQAKMKSCNAEAKAKALKGAERKKFMSSCLKG